MFLRKKCLWALFYGPPLFTHGLHTRDTSIFLIYAPGYNVLTFYYSNILFQKRQQKMEKEERKRAEAAREVEQPPPELIITNLKTLTIQRGQSSAHKLMGGRSDVSKRDCILVDVALIGRELQTSKKITLFLQSAHNYLANDVSWKSRAY